MVREELLAGLQNEHLISSNVSNRKNTNEFLPQSERHRERFNCLVQMAQRYKQQREFHELNKLDKDTIGREMHVLRVYLAVPSGGDSTRKRLFDHPLVTDPVPFMFSPSIH